MQPVIVIVGIIAAILAGAFLLAGLVFLFSTIFALTMKILKNIFTFIGATVTDLLRLVGNVIAAVVFAPLVVLAIVIGRWSRSKHLAGAFSLECHSAIRCIYRLFIGNPARLLGLSSALEGVEKRVPEAMAAAPTSDKPSKKRVGAFDGYTIVGSLKGGGSGGKLYIAEPNEIKQAAFAKRGLDADQVVIKVFSLKDGSSMPQIVRESRALDAARKLGLVLEHELTAERFFYVMRYVPGESLSAVTKRMHSLSPREGLDDKQLMYTIGYADDLLVVLDSYHRSGLWHKDVKPDNIIIDGKHGDAKAHLVDFGLVTPLRSAMTLTTHGTEYFRDPELVRQALRGVKVNEIDGSKFDVYAAGAVLYSMIENSFPAHSGLSQITKRCPEALRWIVRRSMAEYDRRYPSATAMLADLRVVMTADDPFKVKPVDLPSVKIGDNVEPDPIPEPMPAYGAPFAQSETPKAASPVPPRVSPAAGNLGQRVARPQVDLVGWWTGKYRVTGRSEQPKRGGKGKSGFVVTAGIGDQGPFAQVDQIESRRSVVPAGDRASAKEQVKNARARAQAMRNRASERRVGVRKNSATYKNNPGPGVLFAGVLGVVILLGLGAFVIKAVDEGRSINHSEVHSPAHTPLPPIAKHPHSLPMVDASAMVITHNANAIDPEIRVQMLAGMSILNEHGLDTYGDLGAGADEQVIEMLADYRNTLGAIPSDSDELVVRTRAWIEQQADTDAVMLIASDPETSDLQLILVTEVFHTTQSIDEDTVPLILTLMKNNGFAAIPD
jgi:serine/threonine protein kinase